MIFITHCAAAETLSNISVCFKREFFSVTTSCPLLPLVLGFSSVDLIKNTLQAFYQLRKNQPACLAGALQMFQLISRGCNQFPSNTLWCWEVKLWIHCVLRANRRMERRSPCRSSQLHWGCTNKMHAWHCDKLAGADGVPTPSFCWTELKLLQCALYQWLLMDFSFSPDNGSIILCLSSSSREQHRVRCGIVGLFFFSLNGSCSRIHPCGTHRVSRQLYFLVGQSLDLVWWCGCTSWSLVDSLVLDRIPQKPVPLSALSRGDTPWVDMGALTAWLPAAMGIWVVTWRTDGWCGHLTPT